MVKATFVIPKADNNGKRFDSIVMTNIQRDILERFSGYTAREVQGAWLEESTGKTYFDESWEYTVVMETAELGILRQWLKSIKTVLGQKEMFLEHSTVTSELI